MAYMINNRQCSGVTVLFTPFVSSFNSKNHKKAYVTPGKRATAVCVMKTCFTISPLFDAP